MKPLYSLGSFSQGHRVVRVRGRLKFPRNLFHFIVGDNSLRTISILQGDMLVCTHKPFYEDNETVICRTAGTQVDPLQRYVPADAVYYVGTYLQISDLVTVLLPCGERLAGNVLIVGAVCNIVRLFE